MSLEEAEAQEARCLATKQPLVCVIATDYGDPTTLCRTFHAKHSKVDGLFVGLPVFLKPPKKDSDADGIK